MASLESAATTVAARSAPPSSPAPGAREGTSTVGEARTDGADASAAEASFRRVSAFSTSAVERFLGLPAGAWKKRRLFALRVLTDAHGEAGIPRGALVVIEPGSRATPGRLVLVRRSTELTIQKVEYDGQGRTVIASAAPGVLPFPTDNGRQSIVGTIIGVLPRARAADRPSQGDRRRTAPRATLSAKKKKAVSAVDHARHLAILRHNLEMWTGTRRYERAGSGGGFHARRRALANRLRVLTSCLEVAHQTTLYEALAEEANRIILAMRRELALTNTPGGDALEMLGATTNAAAESSVAASSRSQANGPDAAERYRTPSSATLDTGLTAML